MKTENNQKKELEIYKSTVLNLIPTIEQNLSDIKEYNFIQNGLKQISDKINSDVNLTNDMTILRLNFLISRIDLELCYIQKNLINADTKYEQNYFIKLAYLNIYEAIKAYNKEIKVIKSIIPNPKFESLFKLINKFFNDFKKDYSFEEKMNQIRNSIIGHFEIEIEEYFKITEKFEIKESIIMIYRFSIALTFLLNFIIDLYQKIGREIPENFDHEKLYEKMKSRLIEELNKIKNKNVS